MITYSFTYEIYTQESIHDGDSHEAGTCNGYGTPMHLSKDAGRYVDPGNAPNPVWSKPGDLKQALVDAISLGCVETTKWQDGRDISQPRPMAQLTARSPQPVHNRRYFEKGEERYYAFHISGVTVATARRIARILRGVK